MLDIFIKFFLGNSVDITWSDELIASILPVVIVVAAAMTLYLFICFFQFILKVLHKS